MGKANQIAAAIEERGRHFCHFCLVRHLRRGETAAIAAKVHRARGVEGDQHGGGRLLHASPPIHSADLYDTLVHFNFTLPLLLLLPARLPASKKRMPSPEGKSERESERAG